MELSNFGMSEQVSDSCWFCDKILFYFDYRWVYTWPGGTGLRGVWRSGLENPIKLHQAGLCCGIQEWNGGNQVVGVRFWCRGMQWWNKLSLILRRFIIARLSDKQNSVFHTHWHQYYKLYKSGILCHNLENFVKFWGKIDQRLNRDYLIKISLIITGTSHHTNIFINCLSTRYS